LGLVEKGLFRNDLYYRVCVATLHLDDLKDRLNELGALIELYLEIFNKKYRLNKSYAEETIELIKRYAWPGNIRELTNFVEQTVVMSEMDIIQPLDIPANIQQSIQKGHTSCTDQSLKRQVDEFEYNIISQALERYKTTQKAAQILGIDQSTLVKKRQRYLERY